MKKLKVKFLDDFSNIIYFDAKCYQLQYIFIENKNFKMKPLETPFQRYYLELDTCLDLKQFKMEVI